MKAKKDIQTSFPLLSLTLTQDHTLNEGSQEQILCGNRLQTEIPQS